MTDVFQPSGRTSSDVETWRNIPSFDVYEVSSRGRVRRRTAKGRWPVGHVLSPAQARSGHLYVILTAPDGRPSKQYVHRLVAAAFLSPPPFGGALVLHHDDDPMHNRPENLYWGDHAQNSRDARLNRKLPGEVSQRGGQPGELNSSAVLSRTDVIAIKGHIAAGLCGACIARLYGVRKETIYSIAKGRTWTHVGEESST
jgi:hypothetical protein